MKNNKYYVTTPIYYVNAQPHIGTVYSTIVADVAARWNRLQGKNVLFLTGTDEHGQKIEERAKELKLSPQELADSMVPNYKKIWDLYEISYDRFVRTTDTDHKAAVTTLISTLQKKGDIYKSKYTGQYCVPCETFVTVNSDTPKDELGKHVCPNCNRPLKEVSEESYFFRLSAYQDQLLKFYKTHPHFIEPQERMNEVVSFVKSGLRDLSISRKTIKWGVPFPGDNDHTVYVWGDALTNYISALGYGTDSADMDTWWPADAHIMAKDIVRFHAVYWPALLMAAGLPVPKKLVVHGYVLMGEQKMSKSLGNIIEPEKLAETYGVEPVRYYLMRQMAITQDGQFDTKDLQARIASDLANNLGNLLNRMLTLGIKNGLATVSPPDAWEMAAGALKEKSEEAFRGYWEAMNHYQYHVALSELWKFVSQVNAYVHEQQPWKVVKGNKELFAEIISAVCHSLYNIALMAWPVMPKKMESLLAAIGHSIEPGVNYDEVLRKNVWNKVFTLTQTDGPLFVRPEIDSTMPEASGSAKATKDTLRKNAQDNVITIDDFAKVQLIVGTIQACKPIEGSEKLYALTVDMGHLGIRQVLAGVAKLLTPEQLIGKQGVYVANLKPRKMMGTESHGMMLFAKDDDGNFEMATVAGKLKNGTRLS